MATQVNVTELARLGPVAYQVKQKTKPRDWARLVKLAHQRGFSIDSFLDSSIPGPLKVRTSESLRSEATKTVASAYAPAEADISYRQKQAQNIDAMRADDNKYFLDWLTAKHGQLATHAAEADRQLVEAGKAIQDQTAAQMTAMHTQAVSATQAQPGTVSDMSTAKALDFTPEAQHSLELIAGERERTQQMVGTNAQHQADLDANNFATIAAAEARRQADTWKSLSDLGDEKAKLTLQKGADTAKTVADLLDREISKAQSNRDYGALAQRLGIQQGQLDLATLKEAHTNTNTQNRNATYADAVKEANRHNKENEALTRAANDIAQGRLDVQWYKAKHPNKTKGGSSSDPQERFDTAYAALVATPRTYKKNGQAVHYDIAYVNTHRDLVIAQLQRATKITRKMASLVVDAYTTRNGDAGDPGPYGNYTGGAADYNAPH